MSEHFNNLTPAEAERLAILVEETGESLQAIGKILRHGYHSWNPEVVGTTTNKEDLERELGDVACAIGMLSDAGDVDQETLYIRAEQKQGNIKKYLHHQGPEAE